MAAKEIVSKVGRWSYKSVSESVGDFVARLPPSRTTVDTTPWICAHHMHEAWEPDPLPEKLVSEFERKVTPEVLRKDEERLIQQIDMESILPLFIKHKYYLGKWCFTIERDDVDDVWERTCSLLFNKGLGCGVAKVSPAHPESDTHMLCVYSLDLTNTWDVQRVGEQIRRELDIQDTVLKYKPEAATQLDLYCENDKWGPRPTTVYTNIKFRQNLAIKRRFWDERRTCIFAMQEASVFRMM